MMMPLAVKARTVADNFGPYDYDSAAADLDHEHRGVKGDFIGTCWACSACCS